MLIRKNFRETIGNTPLIKLNKASEETGCDIYGKAEFLNPGGSIKDRAALYIVKDAEERGLLKPGGTLVEGTAGNTGIGLALVACASNYKSVIVIPKTQTQEKKDMLRIAGADLREVDAVPYSEPGNYVKVSMRLAEELAKTNSSGAIWANQFDNLANRRGHYETTGPEIWNDLNGNIDGFTCSVGTGGTLSGVGIFLKEKNEKITIALSDPMGSGLYNFFNTGEFKSEGSSITEGIGQGRETENFAGTPIDKAYQVTDQEALTIIFDLLKYEGLCVGTSSGINVGGAIKLAKDIGPGATIVTILCDYGTRYQSKLFNVEYLKTNNLPFPDWLD